MPSPSPESPIDCLEIKDIEECTLGNLHTSWGGQSFWPCYNQYGVDGEKI
jgi:hypothetical protein